MVKLKAFKNVTYGSLTEMCIFSLLVTVFDLWWTVTVYKKPDVCKGNETLGIF